MTATPGSAVKVKTKVKKQIKYRPKAEREKKTIFQYMADGMGLKKSSDYGLLERVKKVIISVSLYAAIGYIVGLIIDMVYPSPVAMSSVLALGFVLFWLIRNGKKYIRLEEE